MYILIVAATSRELQTVHNYIDRETATGIHNYKMLVTGVGAIATTFALTESIAAEQPDLIIQAGIAGCFNGMPLGQVVAINTEAFGDMGVWENGDFKTIFDLQLAGENEQPFKNGMLPNPYQRLLSLTGLEAVSGIGVNEITTSRERIAWHQQNSKPVVESMEGAAFHFVCLQKNIPFLQLRSLSNVIGERDKTKWKLKEAIATLNTKLIDLLKELESIDETYCRI